MTRRPRLPFKELPVSWGKQRARTYARLARDYRVVPDEDVPSTLLLLASLVDRARYSGRSDVERFFALLRRWNAARATQTALICPRCGEHRLHKLQAETGHVRSFMIVSIVGTPYGPTPLLRPHPTEPVSEGFLFRCTSCGKSWDREDASARVAFFPSDVPGGAEAATAAGGAFVPIADVKDMN